CAREGLTGTWYFDVW
nr:immunoglobulin heavy chain junction region [Mus musculus]MBK4184487.1 immunoglobulin heavy chain junction region [Mus musculus]